MPSLMKAAVLHAPGKFLVERLPVPTDLEQDEVLVRVKAAGVCGSDLDRVMRTGTYTFPTIPGHEFCGEVARVQAGNSSVGLGDRVAVAPILPCFRCEFCQEGNYGQCIDYSYLGSRTNGGFAEYVKVPVRNLLLLPSRVSFAEGACIEPAAVTLHGLKKAGIEPGDVLAILGSGTLGLFAVQFAKIMGAATVIAVDIFPERLSLAKDLGADYCIDARLGDPVEKIMEITGGKGANLSIEAAGSPATQIQSLQAVKKHGRVLLLGTAQKDITIPAQVYETILRSELRIFGSWNSFSAPFPGNEWTTIINYLTQGRLQIEPLISHRFSLDEAPKAIKALSEKDLRANKVIFEM